MKTTLCSSFVFRPSSFPALLAALTLCLTACPSQAQSDTVTISAGEFQRMVYSAHLHTQLAEKPELDASLQVLLELQRRNPHVHPTALADLSRQALQRYRANAPAYVRIHGTRDEILAAYLEALRQVPARTNFVQANLQLLNGFMLQPEDYATASPAELIHSGNRRLLSAEGEATKRQAMADACLARAQVNDAFATAVDTLLWPETPISVRDTPAAIIGNTNSALHDNVTMQTLLALSAASGNGSLTVSSNHLMTLFSHETQTLWDTIHTNLAVRAEINQSQPDLLAYLTNQPARTYWEERVAAAQQGQTRKIASATAAVLIQSQLQEAMNPESEEAKMAKQTVSALGELAIGIGLLCYGNPSGLQPLLSGSLGTFNLFSGAESPEDKMAREIGNVKTLISDLSTNMNYRFDRVDQSLTTIFGTLNTEFRKIAITLDEQGRHIARLNDNVNNVRHTLVDVQTVLHRLERHLLSYLNELDGRGLKGDLNSKLGYEGNFALQMDYKPDYIDAENAFFTHARNKAVDSLIAPYADRVYTPAGLFHELSESTGGSVSNRLDQNVNYIKRYLADPLGQTSAGTLPLANPRDWFVGAYAYAQLAVENPMYFRLINPSNRLDLVAARGRDLTNFFRSLTFTIGTTNINWSLYNALGNYYVGKLTPFLNQVQATEQQYASANGFALDTWREWSAAAPRIIATDTASTEVLVTSLLPAPISRDAAVAIAAGRNHSLALREDGTVAAWGGDMDGQSSVPPEATNVVAIAAGANRTLAVRTDGTIVAWGDILQDAPTNVVAVAAGGSHNVALRADGTVFAWGDSSDGKTTVPPEATNVIAIAAGDEHSLALRQDGTVVAWGPEGEGQTTVPPEATNVIRIASGGYHNLALRADGTIVAWGANYEGQTTLPDTATNVVAIAAGHSHSLALRSDGTVIIWGDNRHGQTALLPLATRAVAIAAGGHHSLAIQSDGTVVAWGRNSYRQCLVPPGLTWHGAIAGGRGTFLRCITTARSWTWDSTPNTDAPPIRPRSLTQ